MKIAIIGSGNIGGTLAIGLSKKGHDIFIGAKDIYKDDLKKLSSEGKNISVASVEGAAQQAEVIILAVPLNAIPDAAKSLGDTKGKSIIETSNAFGHPLTKYISGTTAIKEITGNGDVVKCFNTIGAEDLANPHFNKTIADAFVAGDSKKAKEIAQQLAIDMGFENCYDLGGDEALPLLENLAVTWGALAYKAGLGRRIAFKILQD